MSSPIAQLLPALGVTDADIQAFALKYVAAWEQVPQRLANVLTIAQAPSTTGSAKQPVIDATTQLQAEYAAVSGGVGTILESVQTNAPVDYGLAVQVLPRAYAVLQGTDQVEQAVGITGGVKVSMALPASTWVIGGGLVAAIYLLFFRKKKRR